jgi:hypothetical protein
VIIPLQPFTLPLDKNVGGANDVITIAKNMRFVLVGVSQRVLEKKRHQALTLSCTPSLYSLVVLLWCSAFRQHKNYSYLCLSVLANLLCCMPTDYWVVQSSTISHFEEATVYIQQSSSCGGGGGGNSSSKR